MSLSARRAWIEITQRRDFKRLGLVALRKESVDRNIFNAIDFIQDPSSLSARRAWIEIVLHIQVVTSYLSLSARRAWIEISTVIVILYKRDSRSPQGERG